MHPPYAELYPGLFLRWILIPLAAPPRWSGRGRFSELGKDKIWLYVAFQVVGNNWR